MVRKRQRNHAHFSESSMIKRMRQMAFMTACLLSFATTLSAAVLVGNLRCEYLTNSLGIGSLHPRLFWQLESSERGARQTAYQVLVASRAGLLDRNEGDLWDSGKVKSDQSVFVPYVGKPLAIRERCFWKVRVWNQEGKPSAWSAPAFWSMGLLADSDWCGRWIASDLQLMDYQKTLRALPDFGMEPESALRTIAIEARKMSAHVTNAPAVWLRKEFDVSRKVRRAVVTVCGLGLFELYVNGQRISDHQLDPAYTDYQKRVFYLTYDVTRAIRRGRNVVGVVLGNGWFKLITPHLLLFYAADYIAPPELRLDLDLEWADGSHTRIGSDESWKWTTNGPICYDCILGGETYYARRKMPGWAEPGFNDTGWQFARLASPPEGRLVSQELRPVRIVKQIPARRSRLWASAW